MLDVLTRVERDAAFAGPLLDRHEAELRDPRDGALLHDIVLGVLRWRDAIDHALAQVASRRPARMDPVVRHGLRMGVHGLLFLDRVPAFAAVDTAVEAVKHAGTRGQAAFVNGVLRAVARRGRDLLPPEPTRGDVRSLAVARSHPRWLVRRWVDRVGWDAASARLEAHNRPAPTVLRANLKRATPAELRSRLAAEGVVTEPGVLLPEALRVVRGRPQRTRTFLEGYGWIQDEASQLVPLLFGRVLRPRVADLCAAPGCKTMQLWEGLPGGGILVAADIHAGRIRRVVDNARRLGRDGVIPLVADSSTGSSALRGGFDHVLVDAPCTGTGTLRRHPEIRWRLRPEDPGRLSQRQGALLETAAALLAPGGSLVYSVCSMEPEEGEGVVTSFLERHPELDVVDAALRLPPAARATAARDGAVRTSPEIGTDGFFAVLLARRR